MKRGLLIAGGTLGGLGAVLAITPPQLSTTSGLAIAGSSAMGMATTPSSTPAVSTSTTATPSQSATTTAATKAAHAKKVTKAVGTKAVATKVASASASATSNSNSNNSNTVAVATDPTPAPTKTIDPTPTKSATPTPVATQASKGVTGKFTGPAIFIDYGTVQVEITVKDGHISDATALQAPTGRNERWTNMALPILKKQTLAAQSDAIQGASGASYTSYGWYKSLQGALAKAGL